MLQQSKLKYKTPLGTITIPEKKFLEVLKKKLGNFKKIVVDENGIEIVKLLVLGFGIYQLVKISEGLQAILVFFNKLP